MQKLQDVHEAYQVLTKVITSYVKRNWNVFSFNQFLAIQVIRAKKQLKKATQEKKVSEGTVAAAAIFKRKTLGTKLNIL